MFHFPGGFLTNFNLLACSFIRVLSLNMISFQAPASHRSYLFDQLNLPFKCLLVNTGFLTAMYLFNSSSWRMHLVISTNTKLNKLYSSITYLTVFGWAFTVLVSFCIILGCSFQGWPHFGWLKTFPVPWNFERISKMPLKILSLLAAGSYLEICHNFRYKNFHYLKKKKKKKLLLQKNFCILIVKKILFESTVSCILISLCEGWKLLYWHFWG